MKRAGPIFLQSLPPMILALTGALFCAAAPADEPSLSLKIKDHRFIPEELQITAGEKRLLVVENEDATAAEFESHTLHREKIIPARSQSNIYIGPLKPGRYEFFDEFNDATAHGVVVAK